jgi:hypothetical protein
MPALDEKNLSYFALGLALIGLIGLYFWPQASGYGKMQPAQVAIAEDGMRVEVAGIVASVTEKESSTSIKVCDLSNACVSVSAAKNAQIDYSVMKGDEIIVDGIVSTYQYAKFIRADRIRHGNN